MALCVRVDDELCMHALAKNFACARRRWGLRVFPTSGGICFYYSWSLWWISLSPSFRAMAFSTSKSRLVRAMYVCVHVFVHVCVCSVYTLHKWVGLWVRTRYVSMDTLNNNGHVREIYAQAKLPWMGRWTLSTTATTVFYHQIPNIEFRRNWKLFLQACKKNCIGIRGAIGAIAMHRNLIKMLLLFVWRVFIGKVWRGT